MSPTGNVYYYNDTNWKDKVTNISGDTITYDQSGNPLSYRDGITFTWQNGRQLASLQTADNSVSYKYDSNGMRTQKTDNSGTTYYYYDSGNNLIGMTKGNDTLLFYYDSDGNVTSFKYGGTMYYYVKNLQGDVVKIINQSGTVYASYVYDAWGNIKSITGDPILRELNPFRYRSYVYDNESGLYYLQSRYYDPFTGRFLNADVYCDTMSGTPLSTNMFAYCENSAIMHYDRNGKDAWWLQSPKGANGFGHTSLLIQEKAGYWWYFYWGDKSIQLIFIGTTTQKDLNKKVKRTIEIYNKKYSLNISYYENYTKSIRLTGDFKNSLASIKTLIENYCFNNNSRKYLLRFNPSISDKEYNKLKSSKNLNSYLSKDIHRKYKNRERPYSWLIKGNAVYDLIYNNCMQVSTLMLLSGKLKYNNTKFINVMSEIYFWKIIPNTSYNILLKSKLGKEVIT